MTPEQLALLEKLLDTQLEMAETLRSMAEAQFTIVEALAPVELSIELDDTPPTIQ